MTHTIGIDPGTTCGWAVLSPDGDRVASGTWDLRPRRHEGGGMRYVRAGYYIRELLAAYPGSVLAYEEVRRHMGVDAAHVYGGIVAQLQAACETSDPVVPYRGVPVGTIKKLATGKGNADKGAMVLAADRRWADGSCWLGPADDNEADALWCAEVLRLEVVG